MVNTQLTDLIQQCLSDAIDLKLQVKQAHWNVKGPNFIALHQLFDKIAEEADEYADLIAERIVQLGGTAKGTLQNVAEASKLPQYPSLVTAEKEHVTALSHTLSQHSQSLKKVIRKAADLNDPVTADILTQIARGTDLYLWMVESHARPEQQATEHRLKIS